MVERWVGWGRGGGRQGIDRLACRCQTEQALYVNEGLVGEVLFQSQATEANTCLALLLGSAGVLALLNEDSRYGTPWGGPLACWLRRWCMAAPGQAQTAAIAASRCHFSLPSGRAAAPLPPQGVPVPHRLCCASLCRQRPIRQHQHGPEEQRQGRRRQAVCQTCLLSPFARNAACLAANGGTGRCVLVWQA